MTGNRLGRTLAALALVVGLNMIVLVGGLAGLAARPGETAIAIFAPWTDLGHALAAVDRAGARVLGYGARGWIVAVTGPDVQAALGREGAWLFLDVAKAAWLCGLTPQK